ncbi:MAG: site-specific integrase [Clostridium butyricum]|uniref:site-specific integrase n=1 Tax=Clostridium butyricum TaxID=1492 RepID=UPI00290B5003|nr:site-specific integrase [Clostridium butyricum]MDU4749531.1 phage integrase N-terminal SAM-like domain-containing protein [Clostridium butyricum]MDU4853624.1 phage integrase N-terminal SAM-like domain-containing protein [Clostridioides difficile]
MPRLKKRIYDFHESINDFMIYCTNKDLTKKTMKSYEGTLKLFAKYLADEVNIFTPLDVTTRNIKDYLEFTKTKGKYSYVADVNS